MKNALRSMLLMVLLLSGAMLHGQNGKLGEKYGSLIYLDGVNVVPDAEFTVMRDQLLLLEAFELAAQSSVDVRVKNGPLVVLRESYVTDGSGAIHEILFFPKRNNHLKCQVRYTTKNGKARKINFALRSVDSKPKTPAE